MNGFGFNRARAIKAGAEKKRQGTIARLVEIMRAKTGTEPTEEEIAAMLAMSPARVRYHRLKSKETV